jgi:DNA-binding response OmpR family regulator
MNKTILIIEDTEVLRRMYSDRLAQEGYDVLVAANGAEALSMLRTNTPSLILLDLIMPVMSGLEVLDVVKRDPRLMSVPVVILSNLGQEEDIRRGIEMGAVDYLIKNDARPNDVASRINSILIGAPSSESEAPHDDGPTSYKLKIQDHEADADRFILDAHLHRRLWCKACEVELTLELVPKSERQHGWYDAHLICPSCNKEY